MRKERHNNQCKKRKFRSSSKWKHFRDEMKEERPYCEVTGQKLTKMWQLHHCDLNEDNYEDLRNKDNFSVLSWNMHKCIHFLFVKSKPREWRKRVLNLIKILKKMEKLNTTE